MNTCPSPLASSPQSVEVLSDEAAKTQWLLGRMQELVDEGDVIVFAGQRAKVDGLAETLKAAGVRVGAIHGDMDQVRTGTGGRGNEVPVM